MEDNVCQTSLTVPAADSSVSRSCGERALTFTEVAAYSKKGNSPDDQTERSARSPSGYAQDIKLLHSA
jgi:hypothetical protein